MGSHFIKSESRAQATKDNARRQLPDALGPLMQAKSWVIWRLERKGDGWTKPPFQARHPDSHASTTNPDTWSDYATAVKAADAMAEEGGIGYVLNGSKVCGIDLDDCRDAKTGKILYSEAQAIIDAAGSYAEVSPSGEGVHVFGLGTGEPVGTEIPMDGWKIEVYRNTARYLTVTGDEIGHCVRLKNIDALVDDLARRKKGGGDAKDKSSSGQFHKLVIRLAGEGKSIDEIVAQIEAHPKRYAETKAAVYQKEGRLRQEVERSYGKWKAAQPETPRAKKGEASTPLHWLGGTPKPCLHDAAVALVSLGVNCQFDTFHERMVIDGVKYNEVMVARLRNRILDKFAFDPGKDHTYDALMRLGLRNEFHPVLDYLDGLSWDGRARLDTWVCDYLGCPDKSLQKMIGRKMLLAGVRRIRKPGCKFDQIIVLEGDEGIGKSTALVELASKDNHSDQTILGRHMSDKEIQEVLKGKWIHEIADLKGYKAADNESIKAFASRTTDRARPAWGHAVIEQERTCIEVATTNSKEYLRGEEGNRRWWPLETGAIRLPALRRDRDQLWAEACHYEAAGETLVMPEEMWPRMRQVQEERREHNPLADKLHDVEGHRVWNAAEQHEEERIASNALMEDILKLKPRDMTMAMSKQVADAMRRLGWKGPKKIRVTGKSVPERGYWRIVTDDEATTRNNPEEED
jgi:hypothetical protein